MLNYLKSWGIILIVINFTKFVKMFLANFFIFNFSNGMKLLNIYEYIKKKNLFKNMWHEVLFLWFVFIHVSIKKKIIIYFYIYRILTLDKYCFFFLFIILLFWWKFEKKLRYQKCCPEFILFSHNYFSQINGNVSNLIIDR